MQQYQSRIGSVSAAALIAGALLASDGTLAQQISGTPGSPSATTTIEGNQLPPPPQPFRRRDQGQCRAVEGRGGRRASCRPRARRTCC